jgi:F-type H+-transporting ATPase subunit delta
MAEPSTVARPYAEAAFRLADGADALGKWSEMLGALALVADDARVRAAVAEPGKSDAQAAGVFIGILSGRLSGEAENFLRVLAENGRLELLPEIRAQFETL